MPKQAAPIPPNALIRNDAEEAVYHAAFGAAWAQIATRITDRYLEASLHDSRAGAMCTRRECSAAALADFCADVSIEAQLIAEAAVLNYRRIAGP